MTEVVITKLAVILSLTIFGYIGGKLRLITDEGYISLSNIVISITLPAFLFTSTIAGVSKEPMRNLVFAPVFGFINVIVMLSVILLIGKVARIPKEKIGTFGILCSITNSYYIGYPLILLLLGERGIAYAVAYDTGACVAFWSLVIMFVGGETKMRVVLRQILNPALVSILLALVISLLGVKLPQIVIESAGIMGQGTMPLAMIVIGYSFMKIKGISRKDYGYLIITAVVKLLLYPLIAYTILSYFTLDPTFIYVVVLIAAMPSISSAPIIAQKFGGDVGFATSGMFLTNILSMLTIPLILTLLG